MAVETPAPADGGAYSSAMSEDGDSAFPTTQGREEDEAAQKELDDIHDHADPSKGDKDADGGDRVKTDDTEIETEDQLTAYSESI